MGKLKGVPSVLSPDLLYLLAASGHGDEIVLADINFPVKSTCKKGPVEYRADGIPIPPLLDAILQFMPLDAHDECPVVLMKVMQQDEAIEPSVKEMWNKYNAIISKHEERIVGIEYLDRFGFYERANKAYAVIQTGEMAPYANIILKRGVINK
ncbi:UNVERIFIED_CONTAM: hypothetical protein RMT77_000905 [Armadillidium vulgare]